MHPFGLERRILKCGQHLNTFLEVHHGQSFLCQTHGHANNLRFSGAGDNAILLFRDRGDRQKIEGPTMAIRTPEVFWRWICIPQSRHRRASLPSNFVGRRQHKLRYGSRQWLESTSNAKASYRIPDPIWKVFVQACAWPVVYRICAVWLRTKLSKLSAMSVSSPFAAIDPLGLVVQRKCMSIALWEGSAGEFLVEGNARPHE